MVTAKQLANLDKGIKTRFNSETARIAGKKGGERAGQKMRDLKIIREWIQNNLFKEIKKGETEQGKHLYEMLFLKLEQLSAQGNLRAIEMILSYAGLKPVEEKEKIVVVNNNNLDLEKLKELKNKLE